MGCNNLVVQQQCAAAAAVGAVCSIHCAADSVRQHCSQALLSACASPTRHFTCCAVQRTLLQPVPVSTQGRGSVQQSLNPISSAFICTSLFGGK
jgi:hypothetical protein